LPVRVVHDHEAIRFYFLGSATGTFDSANTIDDDDIEAAVRELVDSCDIVIEEMLTPISQLSLGAKFTAICTWDEKYICGRTPSPYLIRPLPLGFDGGDREAALREPYCRAARPPLEHRA